LATSPSFTRAPATGSPTALARDLVDRRVALLVAAGGISARSASGDANLVAAFRRGLADAGFFEEKNVTIEFRWGDGHTDRLPAAAERKGVAAGTLGAALLVNSTTSTTTPAEVREVPAAAAARQRTVQIVNATAESDCDAAFAMLSRRGIDALVVGTDPLFVKARSQLFALAARHKIPAIYDRREFAEAGGLVAYGANIAAGYRRGGVYAGQILKGAKPGNLPVEQAETFELVINMKTAKALGLTVPPEFLSRADEVIE
jgi:putative tryptophan/tyrosine transport system substrate-binding protein